jgi:four helix bundle protein
MKAEAKATRQQGSKVSIMSQVNSYRDLIVWQKAMNLVTEVYSISQSFPSSEMYGLTSQIRRCAVSIPSNIAEGYGRHSTADYRRFLQISVGSLFELQTQIEIAQNLHYISKEIFDTFFEKTKELDRMLCSLITKLK